MSHHPAHNCFSLKCLTRKFSITQGKRHHKKQAHFKGAQIRKTGPHPKLLPYVTAASRVLPPVKVHMIKPRLDTTMLASSQNQPEKIAHFDLHKCPDPQAPVLPLVDPDAVTSDAQYRISKTWVPVAQGVDLTHRTVVCSLFTEWTEHTTLPLVM